jgi:polyribonucleotide nucleotidyltransferase
MKIDPDKIGALIGPGGKIIRAIQERTGALIEIENDGTVIIAASDESSGQAALNEVTRATGSVEIGKTYEGQITSIKEFGVFVEVLPGRDGMCHVSELADEYVDTAYVRNHFKVGDLISVKVLAVDEQNRIKLSRKAVLRDQQRGTE